MFREYAIEPEAISTWEQFRFLDSLFGWDKGRIVVECPSTWKKNVHQHIKCSDMQKKRVELIMPKWALIRRTGQTYESTKTWVENIIEEDNRMSFEKVVIKDVTSLNTHFIPIDDLSLSDIDSTTGIVNRIAINMASAMKLLLQTGKVIKLVDPYFDPAEPRFKKPFAEIVKLIDNSPYQRNFSHLEIYTSASDPAYSTTWGKYIKGKIKHLVPSRMTVLIYTLDRQTMHNRYVMSEKAGVTWGNGLDESFTSNDDVSIMRLADHNTRFCEYSDSEKPFLTPEKVN